METSASPRRRVVASSLAAALVLTAPGLEPYRLFAQEVVRAQIPVSPVVSGGAAAAAPMTLLVTPAPQTLTLPASAIQLPALTPSAGAAPASARAADALAPLSAAVPASAAPLATVGRALARATAASQAPQTRFGRMLRRLAMPAFAPAPTAAADRVREGAEKDFDARIGAGDSSFESPQPGRLPQAGEGELQGGREDGLQASKPRAAAPAGGSAVAASAWEKAPTRYRSVLFPAAAAALAIASTALMLAAPAVLGWSAAAFGVQAVSGAAHVGAWVHAAQATWTVLSDAAITTTLAVAGYAALDTLAFIAAVWAGRKTSDAEFHGSVREALRNLGLGTAAVAGLAGHAPGRGAIHAYRGGNLQAKLSFGFTTPYGVYLRPELARFPWLLRMALRHELYHYYRNRSRAPPGAAAQEPAGRLSTLTQELTSRWKEIGKAPWLEKLQVPVLERVLREAQVSMSLPYRYGVVVVKPATGGVQDPEEVAALSHGKAQVRAVEDLAALEADASKARMLIVPGASAWLPAGTDDASRREAKRLALTLRAMGDRVVAKLKKRGALSEGVTDRLLCVMWRQFAATRLKDMDVLKKLAVVYARLEDRGVALLPFAASEPGLDLMFQLLKYYEGLDGGRMRAERVDLPEGGHVLVLRKLEPRVQLWLKPQKGRELAESLTNLSRDPDKADRAAQVLEDAGFTAEEIGQFKAMGMEVRHAFGKDVGENRIFITVPKRFSRALRRYADKAGLRVETSQGGYQVHLLDAAPIQNLPRTWKLRVEGEGGRIFDIDTGIDLTHPDFAGALAALEDGGTPRPRVTEFDVTGEGDNDYIGHGTHKASISYANGALYKGMAPKAEGRMGKVFTKDGFGANDGDIMAAAAEAMKWGADVISLSLGSPGAPGDALSMFFSNLTKQKTSKGHHPIVTASMGNSGPFNQSGSQPAAGEDVIAVAAAAKSLDDHEPEVSFFSGVGFARDTRFHLPRWLLKPSITALGGDVATRPGSKDVYEKGIEASKSKDMEPSPSDAIDGLHTRMSGTSMSNPMIAAIALLVKEMALRVAAVGSKARDIFLENLPFAVLAILQQSSRDMRVPLHFQGAGFVDAFAAVRLASETMSGPKLSAAGGIRRWLGLPVGAGMAAGRAALLALRLAAPSAGGQDAWDWIARARDVRALETSVYEVSEQAYSAALEKAQAKRKKTLNPDAPREEPPTGLAKENEANRAAQLAFNKAAADAAPKLLEALKDEVWLVRMYAALGLMNLKSPQAVLELAQVAVSDPDGRVRQAAFLAIAETPSYAADALLANAAQDPRPDVALWAAYALGRHGNAAGVARVVAETASADKTVRFTASWVLGELGKKAGREAADALAKRVRDAGERGNIRHLATAALAELAAADSAQITDEAVAALLDSSGAQNLALTRTVSKFFSVAARQKDLVDRMRSDPLKSLLMEFILANKNWVSKPGALGEMVQLLARIMNVPLDLPSPAPDPEGAGVSGVDPNLGPVHLIVEAPPAVRVERYQDFRGATGAEAADAASAFGLDPQLLERHEAKPQAAMPVSQSFWVNVPDAKISAFTAELEARGYKVHRARAKYRLLNDTRPLSGVTELAKRTGLTGKGVLVVYLDEGGDLAHPGISRERIGPVRNFTDEGGPQDVDKESIGHATHGMGIVGGRSADGSPYAGMAPDVTFAIGKVLGSNGGSDATVMAGLEWAASLVADPLKQPVVVNMSLGGPGEPDSPLSRLVNKLQLKDIAVVTAAGNEGPQEGTVGAPANAPLAFAVGAVDKAKKLAFYSSRGTPEKPCIRWVDFGGAVDFNLPNPYEIVSALATGLAEKLKDAASTVKWNGKPLYQAMSGTSMAAPHSTGKLALLAQKLAEVMIATYGALPHGYWLWLARKVQEIAEKMPDNRPHDVGPGRFELNAAELAIEKALEDPGQVKSEAEALAKDAEKKYGQGGASKPKGAWLKPLAAAGAIVKGMVVPALMAFVAGPRVFADPIQRAVTPAPRAATLSEVLSFGRLRPDGAREGPFEFHAAGRTFRARNAGLEGFLYSKTELERDLGEGSIVHHVPDFFRYLSDQVPESPLKTQLSALAASDVPPLQKSRELSRLIKEALAPMQAQAAAAPSAWMKKARVYELFPRLHNLPGRREWKGRAPGPGKRFFADFTDQDLADIKAMGFDSVWTMGIMPVGVRNRSSDAGGSPYSIQDHAGLNPDLGSLGDFRAFAARAHAAGLKVLVDFVPNHTSMDSKLLAEHPEFFVTREVEGDPQTPPFGFFAYESAKLGRWIWVSHGGFEWSGSFSPWNDTAQLAWWKPGVVEHMAGVIGGWAALGADGFRVDMAHLISKGYLERFWHAPRVKEEPLARLLSQVRARFPNTGFVAEAYDQFDGLSWSGFDAVYNKADGDTSMGQHGWYNAWMNRDPGNIREAIRDVAFKAWQKGGAVGQQFIGNHDESASARQEREASGAPQSGLGSVWKAAAVATLLLPTSLLFYGSQEAGHDKPHADDMPKSISFKHLDPVEWSANPEAAKFFDALFAQAQELRRAVGDAPEMTPVEPKNGEPWAGYALAGNGAVYLVLANPSASATRAVTHGRAVDLAPESAQVFRLQ